MRAQARFSVLIERQIFFATELALKPFFITPRAAHDGALFSDGHLSAACERDRIPCQEWKRKTERVFHLHLHDAALTIGSALRITSSPS